MRAGRKTLPDFACLANLLTIAALIILGWGNAQAMSANSMREEKWTSGGLHGTLLHPSGVSGPSPAVLIVAGSGPTDRDGNGPGLSTDSYKMIAEGLAAHGIRSLRYDKRGIGESRGMIAREEDVRFADFVDDAVAAARALSARPDVSGIIIAGHSEGAIIALLAAQKMRAAGIILLTATGRPLSAVLRDQLQAALPDVLREDAFAILNKLTAGERVADVRPELNSIFRPSVQPFLLSVLGIDPAVEIAKVRQPVLLVHAERDLQISRNDLEALRGAGHDLRVVTLPQANHVLKTAPADRAGNLALYGDRRAPLDPALMPPLVDFVRSVTQ